MVSIQRIDDLNRPQHSHLREDDSCFYFHEYIPTGGLAPQYYGAASQLIINFKIKPSENHRLHHKNDALNKCVKEFREALLPRLDVLGYSSISFVPVPPSKTKGDALYDDRVLRLARKVAEGTSIQVAELIVQSESYIPSHLASGSGGPRMQPSDLRRLYTLSGEVPRSNVFLFDDVITAGSHFRACKDLLLESHPNIRVFGVFIARRSLSAPANIS
jgi:predicted amidophosphoribosyltransferase